MNKSLWEMYQELVQFDYKVTVPVAIYRDIEVPVRRHKRRRIAKKWLKRYGTKTVKVFDYCFRQTVTRWQEISFDQENDIRLDAQFRPMKQRGIIYLTPSHNSAIF